MSSAVSTYKPVRMVRRVGGRDDPVRTLIGKNVVVVGGSRGVGRTIVEVASEAGASVLAVGGGRSDLERLAEDMPGGEALAVDAHRGAGAPEGCKAVRPAAVVSCAGAMPAGPP